MNALKLTELFVERSKLQQSLDTVDEKITNAVLDIGETQKIAGVTATYRKKTKVFDYENAALNHNKFDNDVKKKFSSYKPSTKWKDVCEHLNISQDDIPYQTKPAEVKIKQ